jgi:hypothetical protein
MERTKPGENIRAGTPSDAARAGAPAPASGEPLVWPPPEHEIDDLEVIELEPFSILPTTPPPAADAPAGPDRGRAVPRHAVATSPPDGTVPAAPALAGARRPAPVAPASALPDLSGDASDDEALDRLRPDPGRAPTAKAGGRDRITPAGSSVAAAVAPPGPSAAASGGRPLAAPGTVSAPAGTAPAPVAGAPLAGRPARALPPVDVVGVAGPDVSRLRPAPPPAARAAGGGVSPFWWFLGALLVAAAFAAGYGVARRAAPAETVASPTDAILHVQSTPPGARVFLDGALLGECPVRARIAPGSHVLEVQGATVRRRVEIDARAGVELAWSFELAPARAAR